MPRGNRWATDLLQPGAQRRTAVAVALACVAVTALLGWRYAHDTQPGWLDARVDPRVRSAFARYQTPLTLLAQLGETAAVAVMTVALALACAVTRRGRGAVLTCVAMPVAGALTEFVLKPWIGRTIGGSLSFPSGHTTGAFAVAITGAVLLVGPGHPRLVTSVRLSLALGAVMLAATVGVATVALDWHYFTDTLGGAAVGTGTVLVTALAIDFLSQARRRLIPAMKFIDIT